MGKEDEIFELLSQGLRPREIMDRGYKKSTVYKIFKHGRVKRGIIKLRYSVIGLKQDADRVIMVLRECRTIPLEEIERARLEAELEEEADIVGEGEQVQKVDFRPPPKTQEEKIMAAIRTQMPEIFEDLKATKPLRLTGPSKMMMASSISVIVPPLELYLTNEEYTKLGRPAIFQIITLTLGATNVPY